MIQEMYDDIDDFDDDMEMEFFDAFDDEEDDEDDVDDMLEALMEDDEDEDDLSERRRRRRKRGRRSRRKAVRTARGSSAYRSPTSKKYVTHPQLKSALGRVGKDIRRNAIGIKSVNKRVGSIGRRVDGVVSVNRVQSKNIGQLKQQMKLDGALDFAESLSANPDGTLALNLLPLLKGAIKSGMLGSTKGAFSSPAVVGGLGFLLSNPQIFSGLLGAKT